MDEAYCERIGKLIYSTSPSSIGNLVSSLMTASLRKHSRNCRRLSEWMDVAYNFRPLPLPVPLLTSDPYALLTIRPQQIPCELLSLLNFLRSLRPRFLMEIGTGRGGTLFLFSRIAEADAVLISVDLPGGKSGGGYPRWKESFYRSFARERQRIRLIRMNSHDHKTFEVVSSMLGDEKIDFLFLDGDHTYDGIKQDFKMYSPLVRKRGMMAFHDIMERSAETAREVGKFWNEIKDRYETKEIVRDWRQKGAGIGIIHY